MQKPNDSIETRWKSNASREENYHRVGYVEVKMALADLKSLLRTAKTLKDVEEGIFGSRTAQG